MLEELQGNQYGWSVVRQGYMVGGKIKVVRPNHIGFISHLKNFFFPFVGRGKRLAGFKKNDIIQLLKGPFSLLCGKYIWAMSEGEEGQKQRTLDRHYYSNP